MTYIACQTNNNNTLLISELMNAAVFLLQQCCHHIFLVASNDMTYWSSKAIKPIEIVTPSQDTNLIIRHRGGSSVGAYAVTASSYALMAYMANSEPVADLESIQRFLQEQRIGIGVFYSTQVRT